MKVSEQLVQMFVKWLLTAEPREKVGDHLLSMSQHVEPGRNPGSAVIKTAIAMGNNPGLVGVIFGDLEQKFRRAGAWFAGFRVKTDRRYRSSLCVTIVVPGTVDELKQLLRKAGENEKRAYAEKLEAATLEAARADLKKRAQSLANLCEDPEWDRLDETYKTRLVAFSETPVPGTSTQVRGLCEQAHHLYIDLFSALRRLSEARAQAERDRAEAERRQHWETAVRPVLESAVAQLKGNFRFKDIDLSFSDGSDALTLRCSRKPDRRIRVCIVEGFPVWSYSEYSFGGMVSHEGNLMDMFQKAISFW